MTDTRPIWLLDVDGVINAVRHDVPADYRRARVAGFEIIWRPTLVERLTRLHDAGDVEIRWLTTWLDRAADDLAPVLELPAWPVVGHNTARTARTVWWKAITAREISDTEPTRPLIWTDDDLTYAERIREIDWLLDRAASYLAISPDPSTGLTDQQLDVIEALAGRAIEPA